MAYIHPDKMKAVRKVFKKRRYPSPVPRPQPAQSLVENLAQQTYQAAMKRHGQVDLIDGKTGKPRVDPHQLWIGGAPQGSPKQMHRLGAKPTVPKKDPALRAERDKGVFYALTGAKEKSPTSAVKNRVNVATAKEKGLDLVKGNTKEGRRTVRNYAKEGEAWKKGLAAKAKEKTPVGKANAEKAKNMVEKKKATRPPSAKSYNKKYGTKNPPKGK